MQKDETKSPKLYGSLDGNDPRFAVSETGFVFPRQ